MIGVLSEYHISKELLLKWGLVVVMSVIVALYSQPLIAGAFAGFGHYSAEKVLGDGTNENQHLGDGASEILTLGLDDLEPPPAEEEEDPGDEGFMAWVLQNLLPIGIAVAVLIGVVNSRGNIMLLVGIVVIGLIAFFLIQNMGDLLGGLFGD